MRKLKSRKGGILIVLLIILLVLALIVGAVIFFLKRNLKKIEHIDTSTQEILSPEELESLLHRDESTPAVPGTKAVKEETQTKPESGSTEGSSAADTTQAEPTEPETTARPEPVSGWKPLGRVLLENRITNLGVIIVDGEPGGHFFPQFLGTISLPLEKGEKARFVNLNEYLFLPMHEGYGENRLGISYFIGGLPFLYESCETYLGLKMRGSIVISLDKLPDIIDLLGGVTMNLSEEQAASIGREKGTQQLSGEEAMQLVQNGPDRGRDSEAVLQAALSSLAGVKPANLPGLIGTLFSMLATDLDEDSFNALLKKVLSDFTATVKAENALPSFKVPGDGSSWDSLNDGTTVLLADQEKTVSELEAFLTR